MNDKLETIKATKVTKHTGNVWGAEFPYPTPKFLENFGWKAYEERSGRNLEWEAYGLRKRAQQGKTILEMRFRHRGWNPVPEGGVIVELFTPMP